MPSFYYHNPVLNESYRLRGMDWQVRRRRCSTCKVTPQGGRGSVRADQCPTDVDGEKEFPRLEFKRNMITSGIVGRNVQQRIRSHAQPLQPSIHPSRIVRRGECADCDAWQPARCRFRHRRVCSTCIHIQRRLPTALTGRFAFPRISAVSMGSSHPAAACQRMVSLTHLMARRPCCHP